MEEIKNKNCISQVNDSRNWESDYIFLLREKENSDKMLKEKERDIQAFIRALTEIQKENIELKSHSSFVSLRNLEYSKALSEITTIITRDTRMNKSDKEEIMRIIKKF